MAAKPREKFDAAVRVIQSLPKNGSFQPSNDLMLMFYAYFKQATIGPCTTPRPSFWDLVGKAKWEAWNKLGNMPAEAAMLNYVEELKKIIEAMPHTNMVAEFVEKLGSFYELVDAKIVPNGSTPQEKISVLINGSGDQLTENSTNKDDCNSEPSSESDVSMPCPSPAHLASPLAPITAVSSDNVVVMTTRPVKPLPENKPEELQERESTNLSNVVVMTTRPVKPLPENKPDELQEPEPTNLNGESVENGDLSDNDLESQSDSEGEEFCDTSDLPEQSKVCEQASHQIDSHIAETSESESSVKDEVVTPMFQLLRDDPPIMEALTSRGGGELGAGAQPHRPVGQDPMASTPIPARSGVDTEDQSPSQRSPLLAAGGAGGGGPHQGSIGQSSEVNEQIALALVRLQQDMNSILARLNTLEALSLAQHQIERSRHASENERLSRTQPWWWPFPQLEGRTVFFIMAWPLMIHWFLSMLARRRHRRR